MLYREGREREVLEGLRFALEVRERVLSSTRGFADSYIFTQSDAGETAKKIIHVYAKFDLKELKRIPGIGEKTAQAILSAREEVEADTGLNSRCF